jgi:ethanolamine utilization protein EutQ
VGGKRAEIRAVVGPEHSDTLGAGLCRFARVRFDWELTYDECLHVLEGAMEVHRDGEVLRASAGDVVFLPQGSAVTYVFDDECLLFYAAYPVDWQERLEAAGA